MTTWMIAAAGTGGHVFPALAIAQGAKELGVQVHFVGVNGKERQWITQAGFSYHAIDFAGIRGKGVGRWIKLPWLLWRAFIQAKKLLQVTRPGVVLVMGGYVSAPAGLAARLLGIPLVLHEQNAIAGKANSLLLPWADAYLLGLPQKHLATKLLAKTHLVGNPPRQGIEPMPLPQGQPSLLVLGGSLGAAILNQLLPQALALLPEDQRPKVLHQCGQGHLAITEQAYGQAGVHAVVVEFIEDMASAYAQCHLVVCRAGAATISELWQVGRPSILVPFPWAVDDHQTANAQILVEVGGARLLPQGILTPQSLVTALAWLTESEDLHQAHQALLKTQPQQILPKILGILTPLTGRST